MKRQSSSGMIAAALACGAAEIDNAVTHSRLSDPRRCAILAVLALAALPLYAESTSCNRARAIVEEVKALYNSPQPDHRIVLDKLRTAEQLCPTLGAAWKYAYCSATALGDKQSAGIYRDRAVFNNVADLACAGVTARRPLSPYVRQKYALVVGISNFKDSSQNLRYPAKDATDFAALLEDPRHGNFQRDNVKVLDDEKATRTAILNAVNWLSVNAHEDDLVVIFISSHGSPSKEGTGLAGIGYIVTYDASWDNVWVAGLDYQELIRTTEVIKARRKVVFLDTCYSGLMKSGGKGVIVGGEGVDERTAKMFLSGEGSVVITSSKADEQSWESDAFRNGYFTHYLMEALRSSKEPLTLKEVFAYISAKVPDAVVRERRRSQHPQMYPSTGPGDVRIGVIPRGPGGHS